MGRSKGSESFAAARLSAWSISKASPLTQILLAHATKWQIELAGHLRPELAQHIESHVLKHVEGAVSRCWSHARPVTRVIQIVERHRTPRGEPLRVVEHQPSVVAM